MGNNITIQIEPTFSEIKKKMIVNPGATRSTLQLIGDAVGDEILIESPLIEDPEEDNDSHWHQLALKNELIQLTRLNMATTFYGSLLIRINKPVTEKEVGVVWII